MAFRTVANIAQSRARQRATSFDFVKLLIWVTAASVPWIGIVLIASSLSR